MSALSGLTVAITNFKRAKYLRRALDSVRAAGIRRVTICSMEPDLEVSNIIEEYRGQSWLSFDVTEIPDDLGCNASWMYAAYLSRSERLILLHDDDLLAPEFGEAYESLISPAMDAGAGFASWRAHLYFDDAHTEATEYFHAETGMRQSFELNPVVAQHGRLSLSPVVSVFNRTTLIQACKESEQVLVENAVLERPGMLLGTEIVVYMRHIAKYRNWFWCNKVLSFYGSHGGSGTVKHQQAGSTAEIIRGYDVARIHGAQRQPELNPKILLVWSDYPIKSDEERIRIVAARPSWDFHFNQGGMIEMPIAEKKLVRNAKEIGEPHSIPFVKDLFGHGCRFAMPEDIVLYCNRDIGMTTLAPERIIAGVKRGNGVTVCPRRNLIPKEGRIYKTVTNCKADGGYDAMAVTPIWWAKHMAEMPDMVLGREAWDTCFRALAEESANRNHSTVRLAGPETMRGNLAYTDDVCWHRDHMSHWQTERLTGAAQKHNRRLAREFFAKRGNRELMAQLQG